MRNPRARLSGRLAFFTYLTVHMYYLSGGGPGHRVKVLIDWLSTRVGDPQNQVIDEGERQSVRQPAAGGQAGSGEQTKSGGQATAGEQTTSGGQAPAER